MDNDSDVLGMDVPFIVSRITCFQTASPKWELLIALLVVSPNVRLQFPQRNLCLPFLRPFRLLFLLLQCGHGGSGLSSLASFTFSLTYDSVSSKLLSGSLCTSSISRDNLLSISALLRFVYFSIIIHGKHKHFNTVCENHLDFPKPAPPPISANKDQTTGITRCKSFQV
jgi:hypothetical protein